MNGFDERTRSLWMEFTVAKAPTLKRSARVEVAVIGSGIGGLSCAYELAGVTARTTAHLASALDDDFSKLLEARGLDCARRLHESLLASINRIEEIQTVESIDCEFARVDGYWILAAGTPASRLDEELKACEKIGVRVFDCREQTPLHTERLLRSLRFPAQARLHPTKYWRGWSRPSSGKQAVFLRGLALNLSRKSKEPTI